MPVFTYKATSPAQLPVEGTIAADSPRQARELLRSRGLSVREMADHQAHEAPTARHFFRRRYGSKLATTTRELATLLAVGIPLLEALDTAIAQQRGGYRTSLLLLRDRVASGVSLAEAMAEQPDVFDPLAINMVEVGENSGTLDAVLEQLANFKERSMELKDRVLTALMYPAFVFAAALVATLFLMTFVVPMLLDNLIEAGRELPWPTRVVKGASDLIVGHGWLLIGMMVVALVGGVSALQTTAGRKAWHRLLLRVPLLGNMARKQAIARVAMVISTLLKSGVVFLKALEIAGRTAPNLVLRDALTSVGRDVGEGREISQALESTEVFPPLVVQVFSVGQQSGRLEEMLDRLAIDYDRQVTSLSTRLAAALEPTLILTLAVFVGFILFATILPIMEAGNVL